MALAVLRSFSRTHRSKGKIFNQTSSEMNLQMYKRSEVQCNSQTVWNKSIARKNEFQNLEKAKTGTRGAGMQRHRPQTEKCRPRGRTGL